MTYIKKIAIFTLIILSGVFYTYTTAKAQSNGQASFSPFALFNNVIVPKNDSWQFKLPYLGGGGTLCVHVDNNGLLSAASADCGSGSGGGGGGLLSFTAFTTPTIDGSNTSYTAPVSADGKTMIFLVDSDNGGLITFIEDVAYTRSGTAITFTTPISAAYSSYDLIYAYGVAGSGSIATSTNPLMFSYSISTSTATSTFAGGIDISSGCFAINGTCITGSVGSSQWTTSGSDIYYNTGDVQVGTSSPTTAPTGTLSANIFYSPNTSLNVKAFGAKGDARYIANASTSANYNRVQASGANFTSDDIGKMITIDGAGTTTVSTGAGYGTYPLTTYITSIISSTVAVLQDNTESATTSARSYLGTFDEPAIQAAFDKVCAKGGGSVYFPSGNYQIGSTTSGYAPWVKCGNVKVYGDGMGATTIWGSSHGVDSVTVYSGNLLSLGTNGSYNSNLTVEDMTFEDVNNVSLGAAGHGGVNTYGTSNILLNRIEIINAKGNSAFNQSGKLSGVLPAAYNNWITNSLFTGTAIGGWIDGDGINLGNIDGFYLLNNKITGTNRHAFEGGGTITNCWFMDNYVDMQNRGLDGLAPTGVQKCTVDGNHILNTSSGRTPLAFTSDVGGQFTLSHVTVTNNFIYGSSTSAITINNTNGATSTVDYFSLIGNSIFSNYIGLSMGKHDFPNMVVSDNFFYAGEGNSFFLNSSNDGTNVPIGNHTITIHDNVMPGAAVKLANFDVNLPGWLGTNNVQIYNNTVNRVRSSISTTTLATTTVAYINATLASTSVQYISSLGTSAGAFLAVNGQGKVIATTTPVGGSASSTLHADDNSFSGINAFTGSDFYVGNWVFNGGGNIIENLTGTLNANIVSVSKLVATYASTTALSATSLCLTGDLPCRTTWPTGGSGTFSWTPTTNFGAVANATGTPIWFQAGIQASSTSQIAYASTTAVSADRFFANSSGTLAAPAYSFGTSGLYDSSGQLAFKTASTLRGYFSNSQTFVLPSDSFVQGGYTITMDNLHTPNVILTAKGGNFGIGTSTPYAFFSVPGQIATEYVTATSTTATSTFSGGFRLSKSMTPASASAACTTGDTAWDDTYFYICITTNTWERSLHDTW